MEARIWKFSVTLECLLVVSLGLLLGDVVRGPVELGPLVSASSIPTCDEETCERDSCRIGPASLMAVGLLDKFFCCSTIVEDWSEEGSNSFSSSSLVGANFGKV